MAPTGYDFSQIRSEDEFRGALIIALQGLDRAVEDNARLISDAKRDVRDLAGTVVALQIRAAVISATVAILSTAIFGRIKFDLAGLPLAGGFIIPAIAVLAADSKRMRRWLAGRR
ncbi:MAG: hypothetical protein WCP22_03360 [Chlamydiota bacterium]